MDREIQEIRKRTSTRPEKQSGKLDHGTSECQKTHRRTEGRSKKEKLDDRARFLSIQHHSLVGMINGTVPFECIMGVEGGLAPVHVGVEYPL
jgi:hypothetical protein